MKLERNWSDSRSASSVRSINNILQRMNSHKNLYIEIKIIYWKRIMLYIDLYKNRIDNFTPISIK